MKLMTIEEAKQVELDILSNIASFCDTHNLRYCLAYGKMVGVAPSHLHSVSGAKSPRIINKTPAKNAKKKPVDAISRAAERSLRPRARETKLPEPCPKKNPTACKIAITGNTTPTAAVALVLSCPTKYVSAML